MSLNQNKGMPISSHEVQRFIEQSYLKNSDRADLVGSYQLDRELSDSRSAVYYNFTAQKCLITNRGTEGTLQDWKNNYDYAVEIMIKPIDSPMPFEFRKPQLQNLGLYQ